jgi:hypothetical protein
MVASATSSLLEQLRRSGVRRVDVLVCRSRASCVDGAAAAIRRALGPALVLAPEGRPAVPGAGTPGRGDVVRAGGLVVEVVAAGTRLDVRVTADGRDGGRGPPWGLV